MGNPQFIAVFFFLNSMLTYFCLVTYRKNVACVCLSVCVSVSMCVCEYVFKVAEPHLPGSKQFFFLFFSFPGFHSNLPVFYISFLNIITFFNIYFIFIYLTSKPICRSEYCFIFVFISSETLLSSQNKNVSEVVDRNHSLSMIDIDKWFICSDINLNFVFWDF